MEKENRENAGRGNAGLLFMCNFILFKPGLHVVVTIARHAYDRVLKRVLKLAVNISIRNISCKI